MSRRLAVAVLTLLAVLAVPAASRAAVTVLDERVACVPQPDGAQFCAGSGGIKASDGQTILDANVTLPDPGRFPGANPLVIVGHGYGGAKKKYEEREEAYIPSAKEWAAKGYAVLNVTDRGFGGSCGKATLPQNLPNCANGYIRLLDARYEVHDVQLLAGELADEGYVDPQRIGAVGESYGGGLSLMLATLRDRIMKTDGTLAPWTSPAGKPMRIAGAAPTIPWSSLVFSLVPNGRSLDYTITKPGDLGEPAARRAPAGIEKRSYVSGLYALGGASGTYAAPGQDPQADLTKWFARINAGEPYDGDATIDDIFTNFARYRDPYELLNGESLAGADTEAPAPLLISNGFTDDLFPVDENVRYYNLLRQRFPDVPIALVDMDYGHARGQKKAPDFQYLYDRTVAWLDRYVKGDTSVATGPAVAARRQVCGTSGASPQLDAASWPELHPGQLKFSSPATQPVLSSGGNPNNAKTFDPIAGGGACATVSDDSEPGSALYQLPTATGDGYTLLGAPTIAAQLDVTGAFPELTSRLLDVAPDGKRTLVARGIYRPDAKGLQVFQLHPGAWRFTPGHHPELELLGQEEPYARKSNGEFSIAVSQLTVWLPTRETSGNGLRPAEPLPLPVGATPAPGVSTTTVGGPYGGGSAPVNAGRAGSAPSSGSGGSGGSGTGRAGRVRPRLVVLSALARQRRGSRRVVTRVRGRLSATGGRRCSGRVTVAIRFRGRTMRVAHPAVTSRCRWSTARTFSARRLGRRYRSRGRAVRLRVRLRYGGSSALEPARAARTVRVRRR